MELALVPLSAHGNFYEGDCYVILSVSTIPPSPLILTSSSPESQFQGFPGRSGWPERNVTEVLIWGQGKRRGQ